MPWHQAVAGPRKKAAPVAVDGHMVVVRHIAPVNMLNSRPQAHPQQNWQCRHSNFEFVPDLGSSKQRPSSRRVLPHRHPSFPSW